MTAMQRSATLSPCGIYRYDLQRRWGEGPAVVFIGLNPSTADATVDDNTIRRMVGYATSWGRSAITVVNLFALRSKAPTLLRTHPDPVGPENDAVLRAAAADGSALVVAGWGNHGGFIDRARHVVRIFPRLHVLKLTGAGQPAHPLYLPSALTPQPWTPTL